MNILIKWTEQTPLRRLVEEGEVVESKVQQQVDELLSRDMNDVDYRKLVGVLNKIGTALSEYEHIDDLLSMIVDEIIEIIGCDACSIYIRETNPDKLVFKTTRTVSLERGNDRHKEVFRSFPVPLDKKSISGYVAITGETVNIEDCYEIDEDSEYSFTRTYDEKMGYRTKSMLTVPMKLKNGTVIGVLQLLNKFNYSFDGERVISFSCEHEDIISSIASQSAISIENVRLFEWKKELCLSLINALSEAIESRSPHTAGHSKRVAMIADTIAKAINNRKEGRFKDIFFSKDEIEELEYTALLHDVGKISIPERLLDKEKKLSKEQMMIIAERFQSIKYSLKLKWLPIEEAQEDFSFVEKMNHFNRVTEEDIRQVRLIALKKYTDFNGEERPFLTSDEVYYLSVMRWNFTEQEKRDMGKHVKDTLAILEHVKFTDDIKNIPIHAADHHEKLDGSWYPNGKRWHEISLQSKILAIADIFEALTAKDRPYKRPTPLDKALEILLQEAEAGKLDMDIVELFISEELYHI